MSPLTRTRRATGTRRPGELHIYGLAHHPRSERVLVWRIGDGPDRETPHAAITAANGRVSFAPHRQTVLPPGEAVNADDVHELYQAAMQALRDGAVICATHHTLLAPDGHCPECVRIDTGQDF